MTIFISSSHSSSDNENNDNNNEEEDNIDVCDKGHRNQHPDYYSIYTISYVNRNISPLTASSAVDDNKMGYVSSVIKNSRSFYCWFIL